MAILRITSSRLIKLFAWLAAFQAAIALGLFLVTSGGASVMHAVFGMGLGLLVIWVGGFGWISYRYRDAFRRAFASVPLGWRTKFVLSSIALAMLEEAVTTAMTNTAPFYGLSIGQAYVTTSANYWDVVLGSSVVLFVPMYFVWVWLLSRYRFSSNQALLIFGLTGAVFESFYGGFGHLTEIGMWVFVYGLMIYLPAYSIPQDRPGRNPSFFASLLAFALPIPSIFLAAPAVAIIHHLRPSTMAKFPPIAP